MVNLVSAFLLVLQPKVRGQYNNISLLNVFKNSLIVLYVGCSGSLWNLVIKVSNIADIILSFFDISQVGINELTSSS